MNAIIFSSYDTWVIPLPEKASDLDLISISELNLNTCNEAVIPNFHMDTPKYKKDSKISVGRKVFSGSTQLKQNRFCDLL